MLIRGNYVYRNLEEQVRKNQSDIEDLTVGVGILGIKVIGTVATYEDLPEEDGESFAALEYGDAYAVGSESPYVFFVKTRANTAIAYDHWFELGSIQGAKGDPGTDGTNGSDGITPRLDVHYINGEWVWVVSYDNGTTWISTGAEARGPAGQNGQPGAPGQPGPQGPRGDPGGFIHLVGTVANTGLLPDPAVIRDLTAAYLVGASAPFDLYVQVGEDADTAVWQNQGQLNVATYVTVGGEFQGYWDADSKLDKVTTEGIAVYGHSGSIQNTIPVASGADGNSLPIRTNGGQMRCADPQNDTDCVNKQTMNANLPQVIHW